MSKDTFQGKEGVWRTLPNGVHIFIPDGSDLDTEMSKFAESEWESHYTNSQYAANAAKKITYADLRYHYIGKDGKRIMPGKYAKMILKNAIEKRKYSNPEYDSIVFGGLNNAVHELIINDRGTNWLKSDGWLVKRLQISIASRPEMLDSISHEVGHAIDNYGGKYFSSTFVSPKYNKTMQNMLFEEFPDEELCKDELLVLQDKIREFQTLDENTFASIASTDFIDMIQAVHGDAKCRAIAGFIAHDDNYFIRDRRNPGTELFAELTASLFCDRNKIFYETIKQFCPKTVEIYHECIEEAKNKWKLKK